MYEGEWLLFWVFVFIKLQCLLQCVFNKCPKFIQGNKRPMTTHKLGDIVFNHSPFCFQTSCLPICTCWRLIFVVLLLQPIPECFHFLSTTNHKVLQNMEIQLAKLVVFVNKEAFPFFDFVFIVPKITMLVACNVLSSRPSKDYSMKFGDVISSSSWC